MIARIVALLLLGVTLSHARDNGQWENTDPEIRAWFKALMQPDNPNTSCCDVSDAYWADSFEVDGDQYIAIITDTRPDEPLGRIHREPGTRIRIPKHKIKWDQGNPTGHGIVFLSPYVEGEPYVYCYLPPGGV